MTPHQLHLLDIMGTFGRTALRESQIEAVRAILAERADFLAACEMAINDGTDDDTIEISYAAFKAIMAAVALAGGGPSCGG